MSSSFTPNKKYELQATGDNDGTWGIVLDSLFTQMDLNQGGRLTVAVAGIDITLTSDDTQNVFLNLSGTLSANIVLNFPATQGGWFLINNGTTGAYTIQVKPTGGSGVYITQNAVSMVFINPTAAAAFLCSVPWVRGGTAGQSLQHGVSDGLMSWSNQIPIGAILPYGGPTAPSGYVLAYGQNLSRSTYAGLFSIFGTTYGSGDGTTTFGVPDLRGRAPFGKDNMGGSAANRITSSGQAGVNGSTLGAAGGDQDNTLDTTRIPAHTHTATVTDPGHTHIFQPNDNSNSDTGSGKYAVGGVQKEGELTPYPTQTSTTGVTVANDNTGGGGAHNNLPPLIITNYIIYAGV